MVVVVIVVVMVTHVVARTMQLRTYELVGWTILVLLLLIRTSTQDPDPTGTELFIKWGFEPIISMQQKTRSSSRIWLLALSISGVHKFYKKKNKEPPQNSRRQKAAIKQVPY